jgi:xanthine dehydrogenase accessory factor
MKHALIQQLLLEQQQMRPVALFTRLADGCQSLLTQSGLAGDLQPDEEQLAQAQSLLVQGRSALIGEHSELFLRTYVPSSRLFLIGAVHIAQALAPMATAAGFEVTVIDPRRAFCQQARFPGVSMFAQWPDEILKQCQLDSQCAVVTLTHDPKIDDPALEIALNSPAFYIGSLGSSRTHAQRVTRLSEMGLGEQLDRIHAPVGLGLGGRAPAEIAVAVLAQIIKVRYQDDGKK